MDTNRKIGRKEMSEGIMIVGITQTYPASRAALNT
jgi:hypothetical protein